MLISYLQGSPNQIDSDSLRYHLLNKMLESVKPTPPPQQNQGAEFTRIICSGNRLVNGAIYAGSDATVQNNTIVNGYIHAGGHRREQV